MSVKERLRRQELRTRKAGKPSPEEVARCQMFFHEHGGQWPEDASPQTIELAAAMIANSARGIDIFKQEVAHGH